MDRTEARRDRSQLRNQLVRQRRALIEFHFLRLPLSASKPAAAASEAGAFVFGCCKIGNPLRFIPRVPAGSSCASKSWVRRLEADSRNGTAPAKTAVAFELQSSATSPARRPRSPFLTTAKSGFSSALPRICARKSSPHLSSIHTNKARPTRPSAAFFYLPLTLTK